MDFNLTKPCAKCPFRADCPPGWLGRPRAKEIMDGLLADASFSCHETVTYDDDGEQVPTDNERHCAGATILLEKLNRPNQMMRWMERLGFYNRKALDMAAPVFDTPAAFVRHHAARRKRPTKATSRET